MQLYLTNKSGQRREENKYRCSYCNRLFLSIGFLYFVVIPFCVRTIVVVSQAGFRVRLVDPVALVAFVKCIIGKFVKRFYCCRFQLGQEYSTPVSMGACFLAVDVLCRPAEYLKGVFSSADPGGSNFKLGKQN